MDNATISTAGGNITLSLDELTTLNGGAVVSIAMQRVKPCYGDDASARDISLAFPMPVTVVNAGVANNVVTGPTLTKGTQASTGFSVQNLHDAGRTLFAAATAIAGVTAVNAEALMTLDVSRDGAAASSISTIPVTANKRLRLTGMMVGMISTAAAVLSARVSLRLNPSGAATAASPIVITVPLSSAPATAQMGNEVFVPFPEGIEFSGNNQIGVSHVANVTTGTLWVTLFGYEY